MLLGYLIMCLIFGTTFVSIKVGLLSGFPPLLFAGLRFTSAGLLTWLLARERGIALPTARRDLLQIAAVGLTSTTIPFAALFWSQQYITAGLASVLTASLPVMTLLNRSRATAIAPLHLIGVALGTLGVGLVLSPSLQLAGGITLLASAAILSAEFFNARGNLRAQRVMRSGIHPLAFNTFQMLFGGLGLLLSSLLLERGRPLQITPAAWWALAYLSIVGSVIARGLYYWLIDRTGPLFPATWTYLSPVITTFVGAWLLAEPLTPTLLLGVLLVVGGVATTNLSTLRSIIQTWGRPRSTSS
ncbi:MAG: DMT family transporter [Bacillota bacterium]